MPKKQFSKDAKVRDLLTVREYSAKHKKSIWAVEWMCRKGDLPCRKVGHMWVIEDK